MGRRGEELGDGGDGRGGVSEWKGGRKRTRWGEVGGKEEITLSQYLCIQESLLSVPNIKIALYYSSSIVSYIPSGQLMPMLPATCPQYVSIPDRVPPW